MTLQQIKDNAPHGATHYYQQKNGKLIYFKYFSDSGGLYRMTPVWTATTFTLDRLMAL